MRSLFAALALLVPSTVAPASVDQVVIPESAIVQVICPVTGGWSAGTAFRVGGYLLSVNHVTKPGTCTISGKPVKIDYVAPKQDFSMLDSDPGPFLKVDCGGFVKGHQYLAIGYARAAPFLTTVALIATGQTSDGFAILEGIFTVIPGMSGGAVIDSETGKVVGTVNVYNMEEGWSGSVPLSDTPVCKRNIA